MYEVWKVTCGGRGLEKLLDKEFERKVDAIKEAVRICLMSETYLDKVKVVEVSDVNIGIINLTKLCE